MISGVLAASASAGAQSSPSQPVPVGSSAQLAVSLTFASPGTLGSVAVVTEGATGLDFTDDGTGSCTVGTAYAAGATCTVGVTFKPGYPGPRHGAAILKDGSGNVLATTFVSGIGVQQQTAFYPSPTTFITPAGMNVPWAVGVDAAGDLFILGSDRVLKVPTGGGAATSIVPVVDGRGLNSPTALAIDGAGNLFIADCGNFRVVEVPADGGAAIVIDPVVNGQSLSYPYALAVDGAGDLFIADSGHNREVELTAGGAAIGIDPIVDGMSLLSPDGVAVDGAGDLFIADRYNDRVVELPAGGGTATAVMPTVNGIGLYFPYGLAVDAAGDLFIADSYNFRIVEVLANGGPTIAIDPMVNGEPLFFPEGLAVDEAGDLLIADYHTNHIVEVQLSQPPVLTFADTLVGAASASQTVMLSNSGNDPLYLGNFNVTGADASSFVFAIDCPGGTGSGASCTLHGHLRPQAEGPLTAAVSVTDDAGNFRGAQTSIALSGTGLSPNSTTVSLSASSLAFGSEELNFETDAQTVTLTNTGSVSLYIGSVTLSGTPRRSFMYSTTCGFNLAPGASCSSRVRFDPLATGLATAALTFTDSAVGSPHSVALSGTGTSSPITTVSLSSSSLAFGSQSVETASLRQAVTLTNTGSATLIITGIHLTGAGASAFGFDNDCGPSVVAGASCTIYGHFAPSSVAGAQAAAITITDNATDSPQTISLTGTGVTPTVSLSPASLAFGSRRVWTESATQTVTLTNTGDGTLIITGIHVTGAGASAFPFSNGCGSNVVAGASCTIFGHFAPSAAGAQTATITITDNATGSPQTISLTGTGVTP